MNQYNGSSGIFCTGVALCTPKMITWTCRWHEVIGINICCKVVPLVSGASAISRYGTVVYYF